MSRPAEPEILGAGRFLRLVRRAGWEYTERTGATGVVAIVAVDDAERIILVEQHRPALDCPVLELPAGLTGDVPGAPDEDPAEAAHRELLEETGYAAGSMVFVGEGPSSAGLCTEIIRFYRATPLRRIAPGGGTGDEQIRVHEIPLGELRERLDAFARAGGLIDPKIFAGLFLCGIAP